MMGPFIGEGRAMAAGRFIHEDFMLGTRRAVELYHGFASDMPIIDYHSHVPPGEIASDRRWDNIAQIWLGGDHYKWRAMRSNGVPERCCTGDAPDREKFDRWAETLPKLLRNPLYHWTHLELARYFDIDDRLLGPDTAGAIWAECNARIRDPGFSCRRLIEKSNVKVVCTTDDPADSLEHHLALAADKRFRALVLPAWRPDKGLAIESPADFNRWLDRLSAASDVDIRSFADYRKALRARHDFFHSAGCRLSDHGLETVCSVNFREKDVARILAAARGGNAPGADDAAVFKSAMLYEFAVMDAEKGWTQQFHLGVLRNNNSRMFAAVGPDTGFDSIGDFEIARPLARLLDRLDGEGKLAKTILYNANPRDNEMLASMLGNFQDGTIPGKIQLGSAWWFLDQKDGMERHLEALSQLGLLARFVGMLTDSRSFLSYSRHEYFRRILCNLLGRDMAAGLIPNDIELVGGMVRDICCNNAERYFGFQAAPCR
jgi:glucuronate isomerase